MYGIGQIKFQLLTSLLYGKLQIYTLKLTFKLQKKMVLVLFFIFSGNLAQCGFIASNADTEVACF